MQITKDWCDVIELGYQADNAGSCVNNPLQLIIFWNAIEQGVAVVEMRGYKGVYHDFGSIFRQILPYLSDGIQTAEGLTVDFAHINAHGEILIRPCPEIADAGNRLDFRIPDSDRFKLDLAQLLARTHNEILYRLS